MIKFVVVIACASLALARPQESNLLPSTTSASILEYTQADDGSGNFNFAFKTSDGINESAQGSLKDITVPKYDDNGQRVGDESAKGLVQQGSYSYTAPDGQQISVNWVADENGFQPQGKTVF
jgi:loricrin